MLKRLGFVAFGLSIMDHVTNDGPVDVSILGVDVIASLAGTAASISLVSGLPLTAPNPAEVLKLDSGRAFTELELDIVVLSETSVKFFLNVEDSLNFVVVDVIRVVVVDSVVVDRDVVTVGNLLVAADVVVGILIGNFVVTDGGLLVVDLVGFVVFLEGLLVGFAVGFVIFTGARDGLGLVAEGFTRIGLVEFVVDGLKVALY